MDISLLFYLILCLGFIAFFSGVEIAFVSISKISIDIRKTQGSKGANIIANYFLKPERFITASLVGLNIALILFGILFQHLLEPLWHNSIVDLTNHPFIRLFVELIISTSLIFFVGEFLPKVIFKSKNEFLLIFFAPLIFLFFIFLKPITIFFVTISEGILSFFLDTRNTKTRKKVFAYVDLENFISKSNIHTSRGENIHNTLLKNVLQFPKTQVKDCIIPRNEIKAVNITTNITEVRQKFIESGLSKIIVYKKNLDNILGYIHHLDLYKNPKSINSILIDIPIFSEHTKINKIFTILSQKQKSLGWIVDEYGVTSGIITVDKLLAEVFGKNNLHDEHYVDTSLIEKQISKKEFIFSGRLELDYLEEKYNIKLPKHNVETLSGFLINQNGLIPKLNQVIVYEKYTFKIIGVNNKTVEKISLKIKK